MSDGPHGLPKHRRQEIRLEEVFRSEVRKQLEKTVPNSQKVWKRLNEPIVL